MEAPSGSGSGGGRYARRRHRVSDPRLDFRCSHPSLFGDGSELNDRRRPLSGLAGPHFVTVLQCPVGGAAPPSRFHRHAISRTCPSADFVLARGPQPPHHKTGDRCARLAGMIMCPVNTTSSPSRKTALNVVAIATASHRRRVASLALEWLRSRARGRRSQLRPAKPAPANHRPQHIVTALRSVGEFWG